MKFKQTFHVFVDNFSIIYKQLLFRFIVLTISGVICTLGIYPFITELINSQQFNSLYEGLRTFVTSFLNGEVNSLSEISLKIQQAYGDCMELLQTKLTQIVLGGLLLLLIHIISRWFMGVCNYATAAVINDKMALRAKQPFLVTMIRTLKESAVYNAIYVPLSIVYDLAVGVAMFFLLFYLLSSVVYFFICLFLFVIAILISIIIKMTFTCDWLPALIRGKKGQLGSLKYTFPQKGKGTMNVASNFVVITLLIFAANVAAGLLTLGAGLLITIPSSYVMIICFEFVNYYDREGLKYFLDDNTIVCTAKEQPKTKEDFFRGE
ncbi:MAG: hypothetical protein K2N30_02595 [Clostridia bacterium]|nr:hypothetical protein [Clostridia bacterium]